MRAFYEAFMSADVTNQDDWSDYNARIMRYQILWSFYENTAYRNIHPWSQPYRQSYGMYKYSRNLFNPAYRLGTYWQVRTWGGSLDPKAGDGKTVPSALPILTENEKLRPAIAQLWRNSRWASRKSITTLWGAVLGDVALRVMDDPRRRKVYLNITHPAMLEEVKLDDFGNVKSYVLSEMRYDEKDETEYAYREVATRDGINVVYETFRDNAPYGFDDMPATWSEPYGFIPMVLIKHNDCGLNWGMSELFPLLSKVREADDLGSKVGDQIRKMVDAPWLFSGIERPRNDVKARWKEATTGNPEPGREELPVFYGPTGSTATPLVAPLDLAAAIQHIEALQKEIERDCPELRSDLKTISGDASGRALRTARQDLDNKVKERRSGYDDALVRAQQMAIAIGGFRGYEGFAGFDLESYGLGNLEHIIDPTRPVYDPDPLDKIEIDTAFFTTAGAAEDAGIPLDLYLAQAGWSEENIRRVVESETYKQKVTSGTFG